MMKIIPLLLSLILLTSSCSYFQSSPPSSSAQTQRSQQEHALAVAAFKRGNQFLDAQDYPHAITEYKKILRQGPITPFELMVMYNLGVSYEESRDCQRAKNTYRKIVKLTQKNNRRLQAQALYRLSQTYECLGDDHKLISSLVDVWRRRKHLPPELSEAEVPARLASAYARISERRAAEKYFRIAENGVRSLSLQGHSIQRQQEILANTLFMMGRLNDSQFNYKSSLNFLMSLPYLQRFLLKAVELNHSKWSPLAAKEVLKAYDILGKFIKNIGEEISRTNDEVDKRTWMKRREDLVDATIIQMELLRKEQIPLPGNNKILEAMFNELEKKKRDFQSFAADNMVGTEPSDAQKKRNSLKKSGRLIDPSKGSQ